MADYPTVIATFPTWITGDDINASNQNEPNDEITAVETALLNGFTHNLYAPGFRFTGVTSKTIASGAITIAQSYLQVDTEGGAATDNLDTITIGAMPSGVAIGEGSIIVLQSTSTARVITARDGVGNLRLAGNFIFTSTDARLVLMHNGTNWVELARSQTGAWVSPAYSALDFTASTGNWTVDGGGDVTTYAYKLDGNTMTVAFTIVNTDLSASPSLLKIAIPAGKTSAKAILNTGVANDSGGANEPMIISVADGGTTINLQLFTGTWTGTSGDDTSVFGQITFEIED